MWNQHSFGCQDVSVKDHFSAHTTNKLFGLPLESKALIKLFCSYYKAFLSEYLWQTSRMVQSTLLHSALCLVLKQCLLHQCSAKSSADNMLEYSIKQ